MQYDGMKADVEQTRSYSITWCIPRCQANTFPTYLAVQGTNQLTQYWQRHGSKVLEGGDATAQLLR